MSFASRLRALPPCRYPDLVQPVQLGVLELVRGLALMAAAAPAAGPQPEAPHLGPIGAAVAGLMRFPAVTPAPATVPSCPLPAPAVLPPHHLAEPESLDLLQHAARAAALRHMQQLQLQHAGASDPGRAAQAAELAGYEVKLQATRVALHAIARQALSRGHCLLHAGPGQDGCQEGQQQQQQGQQVEEAEGEARARLVSLERLLCSLVEQWAALKAYEEAAAEEEAQQFKTKTSNSTFLNDDAEAEVDYRVQFPDHYAAFKDVAPMEGEVEPEEEEQEERGRGGQEQGAGEEGPATAAQAKSSGARQLLDGELLADVVRLHAAVYGALAERQQQQQVQQAGGEAGGGVGAAADGRDVCGAEAEEAFLRSYQLGSELMAAVGFRLGAELDGEVETGHLFRLCVEHNKLNRAAAATAAAAAAAGGVGAAGAGSRKAVAGSSRRAKGDVIFGEEDSGVDIQQACVEEISLMQVGGTEEWRAHRREVPLGPGLDNTLQAELPGKRVHSAMRNC